MLIKRCNPVSTDARPYLTFEYGDPMPYLEALNVELHKFNIQIQIIDDGCSDIHYRLVGGYKC